MDIANYKKQLYQLREHKVEQFDVEPSDFMAFQQALMDFEGRKKVIGTAHLNGKITYHYLFNN